MLPRELYRRVKIRNERDERDTKTRWEMAITGACIVGNRIPQYPREDGTLPQPLQPSDFLAWIEPPVGPSVESVEEALAAGIERGRQSSERKRAKATATPAKALTLEVRR